MSDAEQVAVSIKIFDKEYKIACLEHEKESLLESARYLDAKMNDVKRTHKIIGADRIAVMAALNIANEYLRCQDGVVSNNPAANIKIKGMTSKLEVALNRYK